VSLALLAEVTLPLEASTRQILLHVDTAICLVFLVDFFHRAHRSKDKLQFLKWSWIDLVSSIPALPFLRVGRAVRVIRVLRLMRGVRSVKTIESALFANKAKGTLASAIFACVLLVIFSSIAVLHVEVDSTSNIRNAEDAIWWAIATVTTVGYGDRFPVTTEGRLIGAGLMLAGVGLFAVVAASFAAWFLTPSERADSNKSSIETSLESMAQELASVRSEMARIAEVSLKK